MSYHIVTGASDNHFKSLVQFLKSLSDAQYVLTYVWNLGLSTNNINTLNELFPQIKIRHFCYENYPAYFNININAGEYAWKPVAIYLTANEVGSGLLLWNDAGNRVCSRGDIKRTLTFIQRQGIFMPGCGVHTIRRWTHIKTLQYFSIDEHDSILDLPQRAAGYVGFDLDNEKAKFVLEQWATLAQIKDCIAPVGSSRENHRQDQAIMSILYYKFTQEQLLECDFSDVKVQQDCD